jgi:hypothetical protein
VSSLPHAELEPPTRPTLHRACDCGGTCGHCGKGEEERAAASPVALSVQRLQRTAGNAAVTGLIQRSWLDDAEDAGSALLDGASSVASGVVDTVTGAANDVAQGVGDAAGAVADTASGLVDDAKSAVGGLVDAGEKALGGLAGSGGAAGPVTASVLPGGTGDWHEVAQAVEIAVGAIDLAAIAGPLADRAIREAGAVTAAGGDYGPQNALRHCIFAGLLDSNGWRLAFAEAGIAAAAPPFLLPLKGLLAAAAATMALRVRLVLDAHERFADDGCGNFGFNTTDSECDQHNNSVGIDLGGPFTTDDEVIAAAKAALDSGRLQMTEGPTVLDKIVSTAGWQTGPWMAGGPQQPDCSKVVKK